ncbi:MAG: NAD(P)H-dependent oxidoreductase subunit E [Lachnospiraceae bacterium]|nr:NAD(P)H-dependent oxidoreductase subunit E [Lachnospiraceae bacterium]
MLMQLSMEGINSILRQYPSEQRYCLAIMQDMQRQYNYIPREGMEALSEYLDCPLSSLYSMATFYKALSLKPKGKHIIKLCDGTACHIRGASPLKDGIRRILGINEDETTEDGLFSLELVNCLGSCALAPVLVVDETYYGKMTLEKLPGILSQYREEQS